MMDLDSFLVSLYVLVDDWWKSDIPRPRLASPVVPPSFPRARSSPWLFRSPVAALPQREGFLALRSGAPACLLPGPLFAEPAQPAHPSPGAGVAPLAACLRPRARRAFGRHRVMDTTLVPAIVRVRASRKGLFC